jgi:hypothetical protein
MDNPAAATGTVSTVDEEPQRSDRCPSDSSALATPATSGAPANDYANDVNEADNNDMVDGHDADDEGSRLVKKRANSTSESVPTQTSCNPTLKKVKLAVR